MSTVALNLADLAIGMPGLTAAKGLSLAEAAAVCLENQHHTTEVLLIATGNFSNAVLQWEPVTDQQIASNADMQEATEDGAVAVVLLAIREHTGKVVMERAAKGWGFDYWLGLENTVEENDLPFQDLTRLEVSGILHGSQSQVNTRVQGKLNQVQVSDDVCPAIVGVVEFSTPRIHLEVG